MTKSPPTPRCFRAVLGFVAVLAILPPVRAQTIAPMPGDPVATPNGKIAGKLLASGVRAYLGIPYAAAPVRELRWREPQPQNPWWGVYNADRFAPECIQVLRRHNLNHYFGEEPTFGSRLTPSPTPSCQCSSTSTGAALPSGRAAWLFTAARTSQGRAQSSST